MNHIEYSTHSARARRTTASIVSNAHKRIRARRGGIGQPARAAQADTVRPYPPHHTHRRKFKARYAMRRRILLLRAQRGAPGALDPDISALVDKLFEPMMMSTRSDIWTFAEEMVIKNFERIKLQLEAELRRRRKQTA